MTLAMGIVLPKTFSMPRQLDMLDSPPRAPRQVPVRPALEVLPSLDARQNAFAGAVLGAAIGDAMGHPVEFLDSVEKIRAKYGAQGVMKFELYRFEGCRRLAFTQP
jgi:hypothetical protein